MSFDWSDLGALFWPRWVRRGSCPAAACSFPRGMGCRPQESRTLRLLRWHCRRRRGRADGKRRARCRWIVVPFAVTTQCACGCGNKGEEL